MIGIVLWSDPRAARAVFWCEDQGDLAYYDAHHKEDHAAYALAAGDMVKFELEPGAQLRRASNPRLIQQQARPDLPCALRRAAGQGKPAASSAQVFDLAQRRRSELAPAASA